MEKTPKDIADAWYEFINSEFYVFRGDTRKTISDFADWFELPQAQISQYMKKGGKIPKGLTVINKFVKRLGKEKIYSVLQIPLPEDSIDSLPEPTRSIAREIRETLAEYKVAADSPKALELQEEIMKKFGLEIISKKV